MKGQFSQLAIRQIQWVAMAPYFSKSLNELRAWLIASLPHACQICKLFLPYPTIEVCVELVFYIGPPSDRVWYERRKPTEGQSRKGQREEPNFVCLLNRCISELDKVMADKFHGHHLIYPSKFGEVQDPIAWRKLHNIIPSRVWALVGANLPFGIQTKLALHHSNYPVGEFISIHANGFLSWLSLGLGLRSLRLSLLTLSLKLLSLNL